MQIFDINNTVFNLLGYSISYVELIGTFFGLFSVYFASKANLYTWPTGIINEIFLFVLFFQVQLYADMFLQIFFFIITIYGWYNWKQKTKLNNISYIKNKTRIWLVSTIIFATIITGYFFSNLHIYFPIYFKIPASFPYIDSFVMVLSIFATILLAQKKIESWYLWILVDIICVVLFFEKGIIFLSLEYLLFLGIATYGLVNWKKIIND